MVQSAGRPGGVREHRRPCNAVRHRGRAGSHAFGGYDYAKLMRKIQYIEAYNLGGSQALIRSFNPHHAVPAVTSMFHQSAADDIWQTWHGLAHGLRGHIGWVENWFDGPTPRAWHEQVAPHYKEAGAKIGPLLQGASVAARRHRPVLQPRVRSTRLDTGRAGARQNVDEPRRRSSPGRVASGTAGVGKHAARQRPAIQSSQLCRRDTERHPRQSTIRLSCPPACACPMWKRGPLMRSAGPGEPLWPITCPACGISTDADARPAAHWTRCSASATTPPSRSKTCGAGGCGPRPIRTPITTGRRTRNC